MLKNKSKKGKPVFAGFPFLLSRSVTTDTDESKEDLLFLFLISGSLQILEKKYRIICFFHCNILLLVYNRFSSLIFNKKYSIRKREVRLWISGKS